MKVPRRESHSSSSGVETVAETSGILAVVERCRARDESAWKELYDANFDFVLRVARRLGTPESEAEDVVHVDGPKKEEGPKLLDGMSILGNQEAPKALVIVPWKSSELGASIGISPLLDDSKKPVDREVFLRALNYYEIRSERSK